MQARLHQRPPLARYERVRIIGQGLAGTLLALHLREAGIPFRVQDERLPGRATEVAPGIVNPLAGRHFRPPEFIGELLQQVHVAMDLVEKHLGIRIWNSCPILRMFSDPMQSERLDRSLAEHNAHPFVGDRFEPNHLSGFNDLDGSFTTLQGGWANLPRLVRSARDWLAREGLLDEGAYPQADPLPAPRREGGELVVFCQGWRIARDPLWSFIPHNPAKGEMLIVRFDEPLPRDRIYSQSCWLQPIEDDLWRVGATYSWSSFDSEPSLDGASRLQENLRMLTPVHFHVIDQLAGVRPIVEDYQPVIGPHPQVPQWYVLNALGSKGVLQAPTAVRDLVEHLVDGSRIPADWSIDRFQP